MNSILHCVLRPNTHNLEGGYHGQEAKDAHHIIDFVDPEEPFENHSWGGALGKKALFLDEYQ